MIRNCAEPWLYSMSTNLKYCLVISARNISLGLTSPILSFRQCITAIIRSHRAHKQLQDYYIHIFYPNLSDVFLSWNTVRLLLQQHFLIRRMQCLSQPLPCLTDMDRVINQVKQWYLRVCLKSHFELQHTNASLILTCHLLISLTCFHHGHKQVFLCSCNVTNYSHWYQDQCLIHSFKEYVFSVVKSYIGHLAMVTGKQWSLKSL